MDGDDYVRLYGRRTGQTNVGDKHETLRDYGESFRAAASFGMPEAIARLPL